MQNINLNNINETTIFYKNILIACKKHALCIQVTNLEKIRSETKPINPGYCQ